MRNGQQPELEVASAAEYGAALRNSGISLSVDERESHIWRDAAAAAAVVGGSVPESARGALLQEVWVLGFFDLLLISLGFPSHAGLVIAQGQYHYA